MARLEAILLSVEAMTYLINLAVVVSLVCGLGFLAARVCRYRSAPLQHGVLLWTLILILLSPAAVWLASRNRPPLLRVLISRPSEERVAVNSGETAFGVSNVVPARPARAFAAEPVLPSMSASPAAGPGKAPDAVARNALVSEDSVALAGRRASLPPAWWQVLGMAVASVWAIGAVVSLSCLGWGCLALIRFCHRLDPLLDPRRKLLVHRAADAVGLRKLPPVYLSRSTSVPVSVGLLRSAVVLPEAMLCRADEEQLQAVLLHEMAHITRRDHWVGVGQRIAAVLFWWNPLVHWICNEVSELREEICDNYVVLIQGEGRLLARILVDLAARTAMEPLLPSMAGALEPRLAGLTGRVSRLLDKERVAETRMNLRSKVLVFSCSLVVLVGMAMIGGMRLAYAEASKTQLSVASTPSGATVLMDGNPVGKSDGVFDAPAGSHNLTLEMEGYVSQQRAIEVRQGETTRIALELKKGSGQEAVLSYVKDSSDAHRSFGDAGFAVAFQRPAGMKSLTAVEIFAARYGHPKPPDEDFHVYLLDENQKVLEEIPIPYREIERGELRWCMLRFPAVEVPEKFFVALWFNAEQTKGVYLGMDENRRESHSYIGLPDRGFRKVDESYDWMVGAVVSSESGQEPTRPKVTTYEDERAADTESAEALPVRTWSDSTGAFSAESQFVGVDSGAAMLKKADGRTVAVPLERLSQEDRDWVAKQTEAEPRAAEASDRKGRELACDSGEPAGKASIAGGGHAVKFKVDGDSWCVTSVSLHGSRYGEARPPKEDFNVWICDAQFKPIATFHLPYSSYTRGDPAWKSFRIRPTLVPEDFIVCFGFDPHQTKGVFVSHDGQPSENSIVGIPGDDQRNPFTNGNWLIRCKVEKRPTGGLSGNVPTPESRHSGEQGIRSW